MSNFLDKTGLSYFWQKVKAYVDGKIQNPWPISSGGTGATTASAARTNLGAAEIPISIPIPLNSSGWSNNAQTVAVPGVSANETEQLIQIVPQLSSLEAYIEAGILCTAQGTSQLTFECETVPSTNILVYVVIQKLN